MGQSRTKVSGSLRTIMHFSYFCGMNEEIVFKYFPELDARQREQMAALGQLYADVLHSLAIVRYIRNNGLVLSDSPVALADAPDASSSHQTHQTAVHFLDAGCGGGFPGIPMAIAMPECRFTLCDSIAKKIKVVTEISTALGLDNVKPVWSRTEDLGPEYRCDYVVSRAVTELRRFVPLVRHLYSKGILYLKGGDLTEEIAACVRECRIDPRAVSVTDISGYFSEEFFESKKIICIFPQKH